MTLPDGTALSYSYDAAHRLTQIQDSAGNLHQLHAGCARQPHRQGHYDPSGQLASRTERVYDALGRLQATTGVITE